MPHASCAIIAAPRHPCAPLRVPPPSMRPPAAAPPGLELQVEGAGDEGGLAREHAGLDGAAQHVL